MLEAQFADEKYICADSERSSEQWPNVSKIPITKLASALLLVSLAMLVSCLASRFFEVISSMEDQYFKVTEMVSKRDSRKQDSGRGRQGQWAESGECPHQHSTYGAHQIYLDRRAMWKLGSYNTKLMSWEGMSNMMCKDLESPQVMAEPKVPYLTE